MRIGVIGWGLRRSLAKLAHDPSKDRHVVALADPSEAARGKFGEEIGGAAFETIDELLDQKLDAVFVLSPDHLHEDHAQRTLAAGLPTYLEKPMAISVSGCDAVLTKAVETGSKLYVGHNMRHFAVVREMKRLIDEGRIGAVKTAWCRHFVSYGGQAYFRDWHADRTKSTGLLLQKGSHDIDVLHWLCGGYAEKVTAMGSLMVYGDNADRAAVGERVPIEFTNIWPPKTLAKVYPIVDVEDVSMMLMQLDNGVLASYQQCHFTPDAWRNYVVIGDEGRVENFGDIPGNARVGLWNARKDAYTEPNESFVLESEGGHHGGADGKILEEFFRFVADGGKTDTTPVAGRMAVAAGIAATESIRAGSIPIDVPLLDPRLRVLD